MNVFVTGHLGFIGSILVRLLKENNHSVIGYDTGYFKDCLFYTDDCAAPDREIVKDIRSLSSEDLIDCDAVCHLAALSNDPMGEIKPGLTEDINYKASIRLAEIAKKAGVRRFLYSSSCSMYGQTNNDTVDETVPLQGLTAYARSKIQTEIELQELADQNFCPVYLRNATAYGVSPRLRIDLVLNNLMAWAFTTGKVHIMSDGSPWRPIIHAEDIARAFLAFLEAPLELVQNKAFNIGGNEENYQIKDIAQIVASIVPGSEVTFSDTPDKDSRSYRVSFDKLNQTLPEFKLKWNLRSGARQLYEYYQKYHLADAILEKKDFVRIKQLNYLLSQKFVNGDFYWL